MFSAPVTCVSDRENDGLTIEQLLAAIGDGDMTHAFVCIADAETFSHREHPLLVVDLWTERGRSFRALPSAVSSFQNNLPIGNMDFEEFADSVDADGVFRGF